MIWDLWFARLRRETWLTSSTGSTFNSAMTIHSFGQSCHQFSKLEWDLNAQLIWITNATKLLLTLIIPGQQTFQLLKQFNKMLSVNFPPQIIDISWGPSTHCLWCYLPYGEKYLFIPVICLLALNQFLIPFQYINKSYVLQCYTLTMGLI